MYRAIYRFLNQHFGILSCGWWMVFPRTETERESCSEKLTMCIHLSRLRTVYCEQTMPTSTASSAMNSESPGTYFSDPFYTCRFGKNHRSIVFTTSISKGENSQNNVIPGELSHDVRASDPIAVAVSHWEFCDSAAIWAVGNTSKHQWCRCWHRGREPARSWPLIIRS